MSYYYKYKSCFFSVSMLCLFLPECAKNETESAQRAGETSEEKVPEPPLVLSAWMGYISVILIYLCSKISPLIASLFCIEMTSSMFVLLCLVENESEGLKSSKLSHLSAQLDKEKKRAESLKQTCRENTVLLQRQTRLYLSVSTPLNGFSQLKEPLFFACCHTQCCILFLFFPTRSWLSVFSSSSLSSWTTGWRSRRIWTRKSWTTLKANAN